MKSESYCSEASSRVGLWIRALRAMADWTWRMVGLNSGCKAIINNRCDCCDAPLCLPGSPVVPYLCRTGRQEAPAHVWPAGFLLQPSSSTQTVWPLVWWFVAFCLILLLKGVGSCVRVLSYACPNVVNIPTTRFPLIHPLRLYTHHWLYRYNKVLLYYFTMLLAYLLVTHRVGLKEPKMCQTKEPGGCSALPPRGTGTHQGASLQATRWCYACIVFSWHAI